MPLRERKVKQPLEYVPFNEKEMNDMKVDGLLDKIYIQTLQGIVHQVADTARHSHDILMELFDQGRGLQERIENMQESIHNTRQILADMTPQNISNVRFSRSMATEAHVNTTHFLFMHNKLPKGAQEFYMIADELPDFDGFDQIANVDKPSRLQYSNPFFFMERFVEAERRAQEAAEERRKKRRELRKQRRKERQKNKKEEEKDQKKRVKVKAVQKKKYNIYGAEFDDEEKKEEKEDVVQEKKIDLNLPYIDAPMDFPPHPPQMNAMGAAAANPASPQAIASPIRVSVFTPPLAVDGGHVMAAPAPPAAAPPPPPPPAQTAAPAFLSGIIQGVNLKKAEINAHETPENSLLDQIRQGKQLKKVDMDEKRPPLEEEEEGTMGELMKLLERRKYIQEDSDSESDEDDW